MDKNDPRIEKLKDLLKLGFSGDYAAKLAGIGYSEWCMARQDKSIQTIVKNNLLKKNYQWKYDRTETFTDYKKKRKQHE